MKPRAKLEYAHQELFNPGRSGYNKKEVKAVEETKGQGMTMSGEVPEKPEAVRLSSKERTNLVCYGQCVNDMDEVNDDANCACARTSVPERLNHGTYRNVEFAVLVPGVKWGSQNDSCMQSE